jgi:hypothetical protein
MIEEKQKPKSLTNRRSHSHQTIRRRVPLRAADAKHSVKNILEWNSYLPSDCVKTMVRMGWDYST